VSEFGTGYQVGFNAARGRQVSEQFWSAVNQRQEQDWVQQQFQALQARLQAVQFENMRLQQENMRFRHDNAEYERFTNWAMGVIDERNGRIADLHNTAKGLMDGSL